MKLQEAIIKLQSNIDKPIEYELFVNDDTRTLADLFIRQRLNNWDDGFGMKNVKSMYEFICKHKDLLIENNMINKDWRNNMCFELRKDYDFDRHYKKKKKKKQKYIVTIEVDVEYEATSAQEAYKRAKKKKEEVQEFYESVLYC